MIFNQKIRVYCPGCGRLVGECSSKSHIDKKLDFIILYGTDGKGSEGICAFIGQESFLKGV